MTPAMLGIVVVSWLHSAILLAMGCSLFCACVQWENCEKMLAVAEVRRVAAERTRVYAY